MFKFKDFIISPAIGGLTYLVDKLTPSDQNFNTSSYFGSAVSAAGGAMLSRGDVRGLGYIAGGAALTGLETVGRLIFKNSEPTNKDLASLVAVGVAGILGAATSAFWQYNSKDNRLRRRGVKLEREGVEASHRHLENKIDLEGHRKVLGLIREDYDASEREFTGLGLEAQPMDSQELGAIRDGHQGDLLRRLKRIYSGRVSRDVANEEIERQREAIREAREHLEELERRLATPQPRTPRARAP